MNECERKKFVEKEIEAIYEEIDGSIDQLILLRRFLKELVLVSKGAEPNYKSTLILHKSKK